jgi:hypothetical protein
LGQLSDLNKVVEEKRMVKSDILNAKIEAENAILCDLHQDFAESKEPQIEPSITIEKVDL